MAELAKRLLLNTDILGSNPVMCNFCLTTFLYSTEANKDKNN